MKKITLTLTALFAFVLSQNAQNLEKEIAEKYLDTQGELTFTFQIDRESDLELFTRNMSLINYNPVTKTVTAWANEAQFRQFQEKNIPYQIPQNENEVDESIIYDVRPLATRSAASTLTFPLSTYPTYAEYAQQMQDFEDDYPSLVEKVSIGFTGQGDKELLFVRISDNISVDEQEPKLMLTSSMHGDEIAGYPMMLTLIDYILTVYQDTGHADHNRVKNLVENAEIWINPNANPDGTYHNSANNTSVVQARRGNGNNIDLNRNYPDNVAGDHYDGEAYQAETLAFMAIADAHNFVISANFHGGTELVNYPFDNAYTSQYIHPDNDWFEHIGVEYATHCQNDANAGTTSTPTYDNKPSYMTDDDDWDGNAGSQAWHNYYSQSPGVTHGAEWYRVFGGRQDYMNYFQHCKEVTIELSDVKILSESSLDDYWYYNRDALLDFLTQGTYGFRGVVVDATNTSQVIEDVKVTVVGHDDYGSEVYTDNHGAFYRPIKGGTYNLLFEAPCYQSLTISGQSITDGNTVDLSNIQLTPLTPSVPNSLNAMNISTDSATLSWTSTGSSFDLRYREVEVSGWIDVLDLTSNSYDLTGLSIGTDYEFQVRSSCGTNYSAYSNIYLFSTSSVTYCASQGNDSSFFSINRVELNTIDHPSGATSYSDFTNVSTTLSKSTSYTVTVTPELFATGYTLGYRVWIDYNKDGNFTNDERVLNRLNKNTSNSASFTVPNTITTGNTRMRVSIKYNGRPGACETFSYGEVEDYNIYLFNGLIYSSATWTPSAPSSSTSTEDVLVIDGSYDIVSSDISVNNITVSSGATVNIDKDSNLIVAGSLANEGEVILDSDSNQFSSLMVDGTVMGNVKYNRHVTSNAGGNDIIAPPVSGEAFTSFIANNSNILSNSSQTMYLFGPFEKPLNDYGLFSNVEPVNLEAAMGYRAASTDDGTFTFSGAVTTGSLNVPIEHSGTDNAKWNLIGNPYTSYVKLEDFLLENINELDPNTVAVYGYDADISDGSLWSIWNMAYSDANPGALIAPGQGFFVSSKVAGSTVSFTPSMRSTGTSDDFMAGRNNNIAHFTFRMSKPDRASETDVYFRNSATLGLNIGYDAQVFEEVPSTFSIYTELNEAGEDLNMAIQTIGFDDVNGSTLIPVGVNLLQGEQVSISMETEDLNYNVYLEDTLLNSVTLLNTNDYSLTANSDMNGTGRFYLRFESETLSVHESNLEAIQIYNNDQAKQIVISGQLIEKTSFVLYDIQGREVLRTNLNSDKLVNSINVNHFTKGVYLVQLSNTINTITKKLILR